MPRPGTAGVALATRVWASTSRWRFSRSSTPRRGRCSPRRRWSGGRGGEAAHWVLAQVDDSNRYLFDQACRVEAIRLASRLGVTSSLSINFMPNAVYQPENCIRATLAAAQAYEFPIERIIFEVTEGERIDDPAHVRGIIDCYKRLGFRTAIDDFGAGYAGLSLLADFRTDLVKLDMGLIRGIDRDAGRRAIVKGVLQACREMSIEPVAEGVETCDEFSVMRDFGVELFQGYYFARPAFQALATVPPEAFALPAPSPEVVPSPPRTGNRSS